VVSGGGILLQKPPIAQLSKRRANIWGSHYSDVTLKAGQDSDNCGKSVRERWQSDYEERTTALSDEDKSNIISFNSREN